MLSTAGIFSSDLIHLTQPEAQLNLQVQAQILTLWLVLCWIKEEVKMTEDLLMLRAEGGASIAATTG